MEVVAVSLVDDVEDEDVARSLDKGLVVRFKISKEDPNWVNGVVFDALQHLLLRHFGPLIELRQPELARSRATLSTAPDRGGPPSPPLATKSPASLRRIAPTCSTLPTARTGRRLECAHAVQHLPHRAPDRRGARRYRPTPDRRTTCWRIGLCEGATRER
ncbi:hypothetical protein C8F01DRAFT_748370 [Mycena amicta]|nr:hypothetical protein C8F01DRAFT_748370 [Mycena amicta]